MSRQTDRADARRLAKVEAAHLRADRRKEVRAQKGLTPLSKEQAAGYPQSRYVPVKAAGRTYKANGKQECARRVRQMEAA
jgi:hypothetical protein